MSLFKFIKQATVAILGQGASTAAEAAEVAVGTGADNEYEIFISGVPHLFRDEGDCVVHFRAEFDSLIQQTAFGSKLLPEVFPRWTKVRVYDEKGVTPKSVAETVMRDAKQQPTQSSPVEHKAAQETHDGRGLSDRRGSAIARTAHTTSHEEASSADYTVGTLIEWGEMEFPNRKQGGKPTYTSFAVKLDTNNGVKTLQGEGLKDVLADARSKVGERVGIKRLYKEKVLAFDQATGRPIFEKGTQKQKLWDRWVWSINRIH
ncbi:MULTISPECIES: hypothetical protein [unclassified Cupriavidus]|uniref:hypothetical protein n=1 Tax=unclassified Cupriavidus TaxID=2640874 RepID=UPI0010F4BE5F|nr:MULTISPECIES: hypothetical protein [unclassified Cupriavidus]MWL92044.1 hypothetical protein [Cupriavidus sp. SW-Y-13]